MSEITDFRGNKQNIECIGCAIQNGEIDDPGYITDNASFTASQDYEIPIPGFVIIASKRHFHGIDECNDQEAIDFLSITRQTRQGMRDVLGIEYVYLIQEEDSSSHFHLWMFPRYSWMNEKFGRKIESVKPIMEYARDCMKKGEYLKEVDQAIKELQTYVN